VQDEEGTEGDGQDVRTIWSALTGAGLLTVLGIVLVVVAVIIVPRNRRPSSALAWILLITLLPIIGIVLFALASGRSPA